MADSTISSKSLQSVFPTGPAWDGMNDGLMRKLSDGIALQVERDRLEAIKILSDFFPDSTALVSEWESVFKLPNGSELTATQRAKRIAGAWAHISPGSYDGMNELYSLSGFDVVARPLAYGEDPRELAEIGDATIYKNRCGDTSVVCGAIDISGVKVLGSGGNVVGANGSVIGEYTYDYTNRCGDYTEVVTPDTRVFADGRPGSITTDYIARCGDTSIVCGDTDIVCGGYSGYIVEEPEITIPDDTWTWGLMYVLDDGAGGYASIPIELQSSYEFLTLKIKPLFMWAISRVYYE